MVSKDALFHHYHLAGFAVFAGFHPEEIDAAGHGVAALVLAIPHHFMAAAGFAFVYQRADHLASEVENLNADGARFLEAVVDGGAGVEGVWIVAFQTGAECGDAIVIVSNQIAPIRVDGNIIVDIGPLFPQIDSGWRCRRIRHCSR